MHTSAYRVEKKIFSGRRFESNKYITKIVGFSSGQKFFIKTFFKHLSAQMFWQETLVCIYSSVSENKQTQQKDVYLPYLLLKNMGFLLQYTFIFCFCFLQKQQQQQKYHNNIKLNKYCEHFLNPYSFPAHVGNLISSFEVSKFSDIYGVPDCSYQLGHQKR